MPTVVTTSTAGTATAYSNQRKVDRCQNGVLWMVFLPSSSSGATSNFQFWYSTDNGSTWTNSNSTFPWQGATTSRSEINCSLFIDLDDYAHVAYRDMEDGFIYYRRGTPNAGRTAWTWSTAFLLQANVNYNVPDVVAHREGTGWMAHVVRSFTITASNVARYDRLAISSTGTITRSNAADGETISADYGVNVHTYPSIDFNHTGDGKTVAGSTPHLYVAWSAGATGSGLGIRFKKATYSAGAWTWGTEREIDSTRYIPDEVTRWVNCLFDGARVVIVGQLVESDGYNDLMVYDRDVADTATTTRVLVNGSVSNNVDYTNSGSASYDANGNIYMFGRTEAGANGTRTLVYRKWTRSNGTLAAPVVLETTSPDSPYVSTKRGYSSNRLELIYTDGTASPFNVTYDSILLNQAPNAPTGLAPAGSTIIDRTITNRFSWTFSDPDAGDTQSKYDLRYRLIGAGTWTDILNQATPNQFHDFVGGTFAAGDYEWQVRTYDAQGTVGPYSTSALFTAANPPAAPSITDPITNQIIGANSYTVLWSTANQASYQVRTVADNAGSPDTATVYTDTGEVVSASARSRSVSFPVNSRFEHVQVRVKYQTLWSTWASVRVQISYTPPPAPTFTLTANNTAGTLAVAITNPAPGAGQPAVTHNDVYVNDGTGEERKVTSVTPNTTWTYRTPVSGRNYTSNVRVVAFGANGTSTSS